MAENSPSILYQGDEISLSYVYPYCYSNHKTLYDNNRMANFMHFNNFLFRLRACLLEVRFTSSKKTSMLKAWKKRWKVDFRMPSSLKNRSSDR